jgi:nucleotide-binding universal stress UspA family protein
MSKKFMAAIDGSENSLKALDVAIELAKAMGASLTILHVVNGLAILTTSAKR